MLILRSVVGKIKIPQQRKLGIFMYSSAAHEKYNSTEVKALVSKEGKFWFEHERFRMSYHC